MKRRLLFWSGNLQTSNEAHVQIAPWVAAFWSAAMAGEWQKMLAELPPYEDGAVEKCWPESNGICALHEAGHSPLHFVAELGAPAAVVRELLSRGAWRTMRNARGERPVDLARRHGRPELVALLEPQYRRHVPLPLLLEMEKHFHAAIRSWDSFHLERLFGKHPYRLPQLEPMLEVERCEFRFDVIWWLGGFNYTLEEDGAAPRLVCFGASRVVGGSEGRIEVTPGGVRGLPL